MPMPPRQRDVDLATPRRPTVDVAELYGWAEGAAYEAIEWYLLKKKRKARWSRCLRAMFAMLAALGGTVPVAALASGNPVLGNWGFVLLALAAGCLAYDRFFGYSTAWMRYVSTAITLRALLGDFQVSWLKLDENASREHRIDHIHQFVIAVNDIICRETESWSNEFTSQFTELESNLVSSQSNARAADPGMS